MTGAGLALALLAGCAVLVWPSRMAPAAVWDPARTARSGTASAGWWRGWVDRAARARDRGSGDLAEGLADLLEVLAPPLHAGVPPAEAVRVAAAALADQQGLGRLTGRLALAARRGSLLSPVWAAEAALRPLPEVRFVARAWALTDETGVPLAVALSAAARVLRARQAAERSLASATAGARASMTLLALLPACGPAVGLLFGFTPTQLYAASPASVASLLVGVVLALLGWRWSRLILRRAVRPEEVG